MMKGALVLAVLVVPGPQTPPRLEARKVEAGGWAIHRAGEAQPRLVQNARPDMRPFLHPIVAPDGKGVLTEESPGHHKHQTGLYVGILKVNGRDYFHNLKGDYYRLKALEPAKAEGNAASWATVYEWLGKDQAAVLAETQRWSLTDQGDSYVLDLDWSVQAAVDVRVEKHDYGGLFLRMPFKKEGEAVNSDGKKNGAAEGQRARWVDTGMPIEGRADWGRIAILDHPANPEHPIPWRVDGQLGVGPARSRLGEWAIKAGETVRFRYRLLVYTGAAAPDRVEAEWKRFSGR
jgi:hypothetical protein